MMYEPKPDMTLWMLTFRLGGSPYYSHEATALLLGYGKIIVPFLLRALRNPIPRTEYHWTAEQSVKQLHTQALALLRGFVERDELSMEQLNEYRQLITAEKVKE